MTDRYKRIRTALAKGPTPGPWYGDDNSVSCLWSNGTVGIREYIALPDSAEDSTSNPANMHFIAACDPDTIRELLEERDALREALSEARTRIAAIGYPASPDGEYSKDGEWTFSDAVPRAVDAEELKAAFLVIRAAIAAMRERLRREAAKESKR